MITLILTLAIVIAFAVLVVLGRGRAGSTEVVDRDAERLRAELTAMHAADHR